MRRDDCVRLTTPSAFVLLLLHLLVVGVCGASRQEEESPFHDGSILSKTVDDDDVALKDLHRSSSVHGSLDPAAGTTSSVCGDGAMDARDLCIDCAAAKLVSSASDCCRRRQAFDLCLSIIATDNDDEDNSNDGVREAGDEDDVEDNEGSRLAAHGALGDGEDVDDNEDGQMELEEGEREDKRKSPFLGKRRSPFLGKRRSPFLGKRRSPFLGKRRSPFLGKRRSPFLGKRRSPFLGKRRSPFLGKRRSPFLGKRDDLVGNAHP